MTPEDAYQAKARQELESIPTSMAIGLAANTHAAGTSTTARAVADILGFCYQYAGELQREKAIKWAKRPEAAEWSLFEYQRPVDQLDHREQLELYEKYLLINPEKYEEDNRETDSHALDNIKQASQEHKSCVFEGKALVPLATLSYFKDEVCGGNPPMVVPIYLHCDINEAVKREIHRRGVAAQKRGIQLKPEDLDEFTVKNQILQRMERNMTALGEMYKLDIKHLAERYYQNRVVNVTNKDPRQVVFEVMQKIMVIPEAVRFLPPELLNQKILMQKIDDYFIREEK